MIKFSRLFIPLLSLGLLTISCSSDDDIKITPPVEEKIIDLTEPHTYSFNSVFIEQQSTFIDKAITNQGTITLDQSWEKEIEAIRPVSMTLDGERLRVILNNGKDTNYVIKLIEHTIYFIRGDGVLLPAATLAEDNKSITLYSSFYQIDGLDKVSLMTQKEEIHDYQAIDLLSFTKQFDHLKDIKGKYLRISLEYKIVQGAP
ncbi:hypothetical protein [Myroides profundi]|uniref:Uncharacterized protein n=1 Tax=Myroides profundi TaxID=480520 RepID=A0AAJ4W507_MYRPR|nr:hypothetical protein [Myroides profundi]AJH15436.1 hypothetical protein MPR_2265 [Myroides profundi]SER11126.1 hypothetical protein SAMN04488089_109127 [Myroides profundi]